MGLFSSLKKIGKKLGVSKIAKMGIIPGIYQANKDAKKAAKQAAALEQQQQDTLNAQQTAASNALANLSLDNTPNIVAGGTAAALLGLKRRRSSGPANSIATQLGL